MYTIGFVDYYINEWHANNYPAWIETACKELGVEFQVKYAYSELDIDPENGYSSDVWCKERDIIRCATIEELCEKSDYIVILSPSNPEKHLEYAQKVFPYGKRTYVDKTFAPDYNTAKAIFDLGQKYGVKFFSTSALRYASEIEKYKGDAKGVFTTGTGRTIEEYIIHQVEMVVKCMGVGATQVKATQANDQYLINLKYKDGRQASMFYVAYGDVPFTATVADSLGKSTYCNVQSDFFSYLIKDIVSFFMNGEEPFDSQETLEAMKIIEKINEAIKNLEKWIEI